MELLIRESNAAGNTTVFVLTPVKREDRGKVSKILLEKLPHIEQVGFIQENSLVMAGGEFCGNASRAYGLYLAEKNHLEAKSKVMVNVSGVKKALEVSLDQDRDFASISMPLPTSLSKACFDSVEGVLVDLGGIMHFVLKGVKPDLDLFLKIRKGAFKKYSPEAFGVMFLEGNNEKLTPIVYVTEIDSTYVEGSCASGTLACACALSENGENTFTFLEPKGVLSSSISRIDDKIIKATVEGTVSLEPPRKILI